MSVIYHASPNKDLSLLEPRRTLSKNKYIGDFIFATSDKILATMYLASKGYATLMGSRNDQPHIVICADENEYISNDRGGAIYELSSTSFIESPQKELSEYELVSKVPVVPLSKNTYESSLRAMQEADISIHFVDKKTFNNLIGHPTQAELIKKLPAYKD